MRIFEKNGSEIRTRALLFMILVIHKKFPIFLKITKWRISGNLWLSKSLRWRFVLLGDWAPPDPIKTQRIFHIENYFFSRFKNKKNKKRNLLDWLFNSDEAMRKIEFKFLFLSGTDDEFSRFILSQPSIFSNCF